MSGSQASETPLKELMRAGDWASVADRLRGLHAADAAEAIFLAPKRYAGKLLSLIHESMRPDVLAELVDMGAAEILDDISDHDLSDIVEEMDPDDAADVIGELTDDRGEHVLDLMEQEESEDVRKLLQYEEDTAGGIMTPSVLAMQSERTVGEALDAIAYLDSEERFVYAFTVDAQNRLLGQIDVWELLRERNKSRALRDLAQQPQAVARTDMDQEQVAVLMNRYGMEVIPVVDGQGRLVGRITSDDAIDVMEEEASEDLFRMAGSDDVELETRSPLRSSMVRLPWLLVTLVGGTLTSWILRNYVSRIADVLILAAFVPIVLAMGGNAGIQASVLVVRGIALGTFKGRDLWRLLLREVLTGAIMGLVCAAAVGGWALFLILRSQESPSALPAVFLAGIVSISLFSAMTFATVFGACVPTVLSRLRVDPAVAAGPFVTIANDVLALLIYFGVTVLLLNAVVLP